VPNPHTEYNKQRKRLILRAVVLLCLAGALQGILVNGLINVVISSIEKRFGIRSTETGFIANSYDIASFLCLLPVSYLGGRGTGTKPVWIGAGLVIMGLGALLFSLPHFATPEYRGEAGEPTLCNVTRNCEEEVQDVSGNSYKYVFMAAQFLHGAGAAPLYTLGVTYIDENIGASSSAFYLGIFYTMAIVGPAVGYSVGGQFLSIHTDFLDDITGDDPAWVGAWWLGFVICGISALLLAWPITMLPASLPGMKEPSSDQVCKSRINSRSSSFRSSVRSRGGKKAEVEMTGGNGPLPVGKELLSAIILLVTNPTFIFVSLAGASEGFLMQGLATFLPKLIQNQFSLSATQAAINVGAVSVVAGGGGTLLGGLAVKKLGLKVTGLLKMTSLTQLLAIVMAIGLVVGCPPTKTVDTTPSECGCQCDKHDYLPVCGEGGHHQFFNPCYAGCQAKEPGPEGNFLNCTCVPAIPGESNMSDSEVVYTINSIATLGPCQTECVLLPVFLASFFLTMLVTFLANMPALTATLRCVHPSGRSLALGIQWLLIRFLGTIPGPVAMGKLFDLACQRWQEGCDGFNQHCIIYDNDRISGNILTLTAVCKGLSIAAFLGGIRLYRHPRETEHNSG
jgi:organic anion transporter 4A